MISVYVSSVSHEHLVSYTVVFIGIVCCPHTEPMEEMEEEEIPVEMSVS